MRLCITFFLICLPVSVSLASLYVSLALSLSLSIPVSIPVSVSVSVSVSGLWLSPPPLAHQCGPQFLTFLQTATTV